MNMNIIYIVIILILVLVSILLKIYINEEYFDIPPKPVEEEMPKKIIIYILCHNEKMYNFSLRHYRYLSWARPIIMKYQDITWENAFWRQLWEIKDEWKDAYMVGTMSSSCYKKLNLMKMHKNLMKGRYNYPYHHFMDTNINIEKSHAIQHPNFLAIWNYMLETLDLPNVTENFCNYWMCSPEYMEKFILWYENFCLPAILSNPLSFTDSKYIGALTKDHLLNLWGKPYYPHIPFVLERLHKAFFIKLKKEIN